MISYLISDAKFWVAVAFVILILLLYKPVKKLLINNIDETINKIKNDIKEGEKVLKESENLLNEIKNRNNSINDEIVVIQEKYSKKLKSAKKELDQKLDSQIIKRKKISESRINQMEMEIMHLIKEKTANLTIACLSQLFENNFDPKLKNKLLEDSINDFKNKLKN